MNPAILIVTYNRPASLSRILSSVAVADYQGFEEINLIISIDGGGPDEMRTIADDFSWNLGTKTIIQHEQNIGLRNHILSCGDLTEKFGTVIILEDDCFVSRNFYRFATEASSYYAGDNRIAGVSLFLHPINEYASLPFNPLHDGNDILFMQVPTSLGQVWTRKQWVRFREWYNTGQTIQADDKMPDAVKKWPESSWKKYFYKYVMEQDLFFVYPAVSHLTNFGDTGTHYEYETSNWQALLEYKTNPGYTFLPFENSFNKYDGYFEMLSECLRHFGADIPTDCLIDLWGNKQLSLFVSNNVLSSKDCLHPVRKFGSFLSPAYLNIILNIPGDTFALGPITGFTITSMQTRQILASRLQPAGFGQGLIAIMSSKYYKLGYYIFKPMKIIGLIKRKLIRNNPLNEA